MKVSIALSLLIALAEAAAFKADIRADSNRDGKVDVEGTSDLGEGKDIWTEKAGALFLPNIGDTSGRCRDLYPGYENEAALVRCNDASDDIQRAPEYLAPLRTIAIPGLSPSALGRISVSDRAARELVRIFRPVAPPRSNDRTSTMEDRLWNIVTDETMFSAAELAQGLQLGIDARGPRGHKVAGLDSDEIRAWDGRATVHFTVTDGETNSTDSVMLRVAPLLTQNHLQRATKVFSFRNTDEWNGTLDGIKQSVKKAGIEEAIQETAGVTPFIQDLFETTYASIPGQDGAVTTLPIMLPATYNNKIGRSTEAAGLVARQIRSSGIGMVTDVLPPEEHGETLEAMGNLETIPPYVFNGKAFPAGRVIAGANETAGRVPLWVSFLRSQEMQDPLLVDSTWLEVQHVNEFLQFLPAKTPRGWRVMVSDPLAGLKLLQEVQADGHGNDSITTHAPPNKYSSFGTVNGHLSESFIQNSQECARRIQGTIDLLKRETGISDDEIFGVPILYKKVWQPTVPSNGDFQARSILPSAINGLVLTDSLYVAPKQWGPLNGAGIDIIQHAVEKVYKEVGYDVDFVDDWEFHRRKGDIHCATNVLREIAAPWWQASSPQPEPQPEPQPQPQPQRPHKDPRVRQQELCKSIGKSLEECAPQVAECVFRAHKQINKYKSEHEAWADIEKCVKSRI